MTLRIEVVSGALAGRTYQFSAPRSVLIGRAGEADVRLPEDDISVSRRHCSIELEDNRCRLEDLNSRNGVRVNGKLVVDCGLRSADEVQVGKSLLRVHLGAGSALFPSEDSLASHDATRSSFVQTLEGYRIHEELGRGAIATVYRATRLADSETVAIKLIHGASGSADAAAQRLLRETSVLEQLRHPHIVSMYDLGEFMDLPYVVMEYAGEGDLAQQIRRSGAIQRERAVSWICQALDAIAYAHSRHIIHRDIKPENLLLFDRGGKELVKVADFGHARVVEATHLAKLTFPGEVNGTPRYMAPEQVIHYSQATESVDQYSMAAVLYYLLTGKHAFDFPSDTGAILVMLLNEDPVPLERRDPRIPRELARIVNQALARNPSDRFANVSDFRAALLPFAGRPKE